MVILLGAILISASKVRVQDTQKMDLNARVKKGETFSSESLKANISFGKIPLYFIPNMGQVHEKVTFYARTSRYTLWMTKDGLVFDSMKNTGAIEVKKYTDNNHSKLNIQHSKLMKRDVSRLVFLDANKNPEMAPIEFTQHKVNYFRGKERSKWFTGIKTSKAVLYRDLYKNIDLKVYGTEKEIEYDWIVKPGGDPETIRFEYQNVKGTQIDERGNLLIETGAGELIHQRPISFQETCMEPKGERRGHVNSNVNVEFKKIDEDTYGFEVGEYDKSKELIIDPVVLLYSTFLGGSGDDYGYGIAVDSSGCAYVTGNTDSSDFPTQNAYESNHSGNFDLFVTKFSSPGTSLIYSTFLGGSGNDLGRGIAVDSSGCAYVSGRTNSNDFPTKNAYQANLKGDYDAFVSKLSSSGSSLVYSTFLGGSGKDYGYEIAVYSSWAYVTGQTLSADFPTQNGYQTHGGGWDAFVTKFSSSGSSLIHSTFLGGAGNDYGHRITVDNSGCAYVTGDTDSSNFPTQNAYQKNSGGDLDAFITKFSTTGSSLIYSTYLGGKGTDSAGYGIAVDTSGCAYVSGRTNSNNFPTKNPYQANLKGDYDAFVTKFAATGTTLEYSTYLGGIEWDNGNHVVVNNAGNAYVIGSTKSSNFPVKKAYQNTYNGSYDVFVSMFASTGTSLSFSTFLGGSNDDRGDSIALDSSGNVYVTGSTESSDFPTKNGFQNTINGGSDVFVSKFSTDNIGTLCGGVDNCDLSWTTGGSADWFEQTNTYYYDDDAVQSGDIGDSLSSYIRTAVTGPGILRFWWKVSSSYSDRLKFYIDNNEQTYISGTSGNWIQETFNISSGPHTLKWSYEKNASTSAGSDCGWLDKVEYTTSFEISLNRSRLNFGAVSGSTTGSQTVSISKNTAGSLNWSAAVNQSWLSCSPTSGTSPGVITVSVNTAGLSAGTYNGTITVSDPNASNSPQIVSVTLNVYTQGASSPPFGTYATPDHGSTVRSSVPFTGWVLDDIGVASVKLYRHTTGSLAYIGDAVLVEGARPDVELAFPGYPNNYKAGWGYMMLTNFLPNGGNGTFTIDAIATDVEGYQTTLGSKTVIVDNANAVKPFGAIDTPAQGGSASGNNSRNQGWVLTPLPNTIPTDGSTIDVYVDSVYLGHPTYNLYRADIATLFPGYNNSNGALAYFDFDTTTYSNGVHTIMWIAADNGGNADGIGSRYFTIQNSNSGSAAAASSSLLATERKQEPFSYLEISEIPINYSEPIGIKKGFKKYSQPVIVNPDENGTIQITLKELERIEIHFNHDEIEPIFISGWMKQGYQLRALPTGSNLDSNKGVFYWHPGVGFTGEYRLVFVVEDQNGNMTRTDIAAHIIPRFSNLD
jgi:hypothetical protein